MTSMSIPYKPMKNIFHTTIITKLWSMKFVMYNFPYIWIYIFCNAMDESSYDIHGNMFHTKFKLVGTLTTFPYIPYCEYKT